MNSPPGGKGGSVGSRWQVLDDDDCACDYGANCLFKRFTRLDKCDAMKDCECGNVFHAKCVEASLRLEETQNVAVDSEKCNLCGCEEVCQDDERVKERNNKPEEDDFSDGVSQAAKINNRGQLLPRMAKVCLHAGVRSGYCCRRLTSSWNRANRASSKASKLFLRK